MGKDVGNQYYLHVVENWFLVGFMECRFVSVCTQQPILNELFLVRIDLSFVWPKIQVPKSFLD